MASLRRWLKRRGLAAQDVADVDVLEQWLTLGQPGERALALRYLSLRAPVAEWAPRALEALRAPEPAVRAAGAWALGWAADAGRPVPGALEPLWQAARRERTDTGRRGMAVAAVRCGAPVASAWALLADAAERRVATPDGPRRPVAGGPDGVDAAAVLWRRGLALDAMDVAPAALDVQPGPALRAIAQDRLAADPEDREALRALAVQQHPDDAERLRARKRQSGRRESHAICEALGLHGDARSVPTLIEVLLAMDVDPGHGFAGRRAAAIALGRIGDPDLGPVLVQALADEAHDHEGRPGAGMGVQFPVRAVLLAALGEAGCRDAAPLVARYLADRSGTALGGFFLPAMDAAWKLDQEAPLVALLPGAPRPAAHALGALALMGHLDRVRRHVDDARPEVASTARLALRLRQDQGEPKGLSDE